MARDSVFLRFFVFSRILSITIYARLQYQATSTFYYPIPPTPSSRNLIHSKNPKYMLKKLPVLDQRRRRGGGEGGLAHTNDYFRKIVHDTTIRIDVALRGTIYYIKRTAPDTMCGCIVSRSVHYDEHRRVGRADAALYCTIHQKSTQSTFLPRLCKELVGRSRPRR